MGFAEILTLIFVVLKLVGYIGWAWWVVFLPVILTYSIGLLFIIGALVLSGIVAYYGSK